MAYKDPLKATSICMVIAANADEIDRLHDEERGLAEASRAARAKRFWGWFYCLTPASSANLAARERLLERARWLILQNALLISALEES